MVSTQTLFSTVHLVDPSVRSCHPHAFICTSFIPSLTLVRMNRRKADFRFAYKFLEDEL